MKNALEILQFISYSSNTEVSKISSFGSVKKESLNGLNRAIRVLYNSKDWNFRRSIDLYTINKSVYLLDMPYGIISENGIKIDDTALEYDENIPFYAEATGKPTSYHINQNDKIVFYPKPDKEYNATIISYSSYPVISEDDTLRTSFSSEREGDSINIKPRLEDLFLDCLAYFCNEILNGDPTDEEYQEHKLRYSEVYRLLETADSSSYDFDNNKGFIFPWQQ